MKQMRALAVVAAAASSWDRAAAAAHALLVGIALVPGHDLVGLAPGLVVALRPALLLALYSEEHHNCSDYTPIVSNNETPPSTGFRCSGKSPRTSWRHVSHPPWRYAF